MTLIRAVLVDDEPIARKVLREGLEVVAPDVMIAGQAENGLQGVNLIHSLKPDLVFLDLQMPGMDGFEVLGALDGSVLPCIVMVTAFDQQAIRAFDRGGIDYLLKPVGEKRLTRCMERVRQLRENSVAAAESMALLQKLLPAIPAARPGSREEFIAGKPARKAQRLWNW